MGARSGVLAVVLGAAALTAPAVGSADSIVFVRAGDVQLTGEQGTLRVTSDGGYENPSMADDGTIVAIRRTLNTEGSPVRYVYRMSPTGRLLNRPTVALDPENSNYTGPLGAQVSPDGRLLAFHLFNRSPLMPRPEMPRVAIGPTDRDMQRSNEIFEAGYYLNPTWIGSSTIVLFGTPGFIPNVQTYTLGSEGIADWFDPEDGADLGGGEISADGTRFVATAEGASQLRFYAMTGPPPAAPRATCQFNGDPGTFERPRWAPDGRGVVWEQPDGLHIARVPAIDDCPAIRARLVAPGGSDPDWGPAGVPVSGRPRVQRYPLAVAVKVACAKPCSLKVKLVQRGRTIARRAKRLTKAGTARVVLPKMGRKGRATLMITMDGKTQRRGVML